MEDLGNPFEEESTHLLVLDSNEIADCATVETARRVGQEQFQAFVDDHLVKRFKAIDDVIHCSNFKLFNSTSKQNASREKLQVASLKCDVALFSRLYIGYPKRGGNLDEFFS